ncbi:MAG: hypothetical protein IPK88_16855 [Saprospiraceae bacterium]|nr:hypothetical protein [Candidatus Defluviibacterium haderslevense]
MSKLLIFLIFISLALPSFAQNKFDNALNETSIDLATKLASKEKKRVVVLYVTDINKANTIAGKYIADILSIGIVNNVENFQVFDRENLNSIVDANKLIAEGYIDVDRAKELGKLLAVDAIIIGNYTVLSNTLKLTVKALDANSGFVIAATMKDLPLNEDAGSILGININSLDNNQNLNLENRGFNRPLNSNERINNPETVSKDCYRMNYGDFCFENKTAKKYTVLISTTGLSERDMNNAPQITLNSGETQCFYSLQSGIFYYSAERMMITQDDFTYENANNRFSTGQINVEKCKSKTFTIK